MVHTETDDVVRQFIDGDERAVAELFNEWNGPLVAFLRRFNLYRVDAEDIAQDTWLKAWRNRKRLDPEVATFSTWLFTIARNLAISEYRRKDNAPFHDIWDCDHLRSGDGDDVIHDVHIRLQIKHLDAILEILKDDYAEVIILRDMHGLTYDEIADIIGRPIGTVKSLIFRGREKIKEVWGAI